MPESQHTPRRRLEFGEHFRFGVPEIDRAHASLIELLNAVLYPGLDARAMSDLLHRFASIYSAHCRAEEAFLRSIGYTRLEDHSREHNALNRRINECYRAFTADLGAARKPLEALCTAFSEHMLYDLDYKSHLDETRER